MPTLTELIEELAANPAAWVRCQCCGWIDVDAVLVKSRTETNVKFYCPYCDKEGESAFAFGDDPEAALPPTQEVSTP
jgi:hypothetical protein